MNVTSTAVSAAEPVPVDGVVASSVYVDGRRVANIAIEEASSWRSKPGHVVWIGLHEPDMSVLASVQRQFQLHDLAIEDADHAHQRPKIEQYGDAPVHRGANRATGRRRDRLRRDAPVRRRRLSGLGAPRRIDILCAGARALRKLSARAGPRRGLHPLRNPRLHRRQLFTGARDDPGGGRGDGAAGARQRHDADADRAALPVAARPACACATPSARWSRSAAGSSTTACR